jgi:hypothetical protein
MANCRYGTCDVTSGRITTKGRFSQAYGRVEARMKIPSGRGLWPAFWMMGNHIDVVRWPSNGEVDLMEIIGREPGTLYGTVHGPGYSGGQGPGGSANLHGGARFVDALHIFVVEWSPETIIGGLTVGRITCSAQARWLVGKSRGSYPQSYPQESSPPSAAVSRRGLLTGLGVGTAALSLSALLTPSPAATTMPKYALMDASQVLMPTSSGG